MLDFKKYLENIIVKKVNFLQRELINDCFLNKIGIKVVIKRTGFEADFLINLGSYYIGLKKFQKNLKQE